MAKLTQAEVCQAMGMKPREILDWFDEVGGATLVVTVEGAQTRIHADGSTSPVVPRLALPGQHAEVAQLVEEPPIKVPASVGKAKKDARDGGE